jgi:NADP-reducing hydrogenase subunit HndB
MIETIEQLAAARQSALSAFYPDKLRIGVGVGTCGVANGAEEILDAIRNEVEKRNLDFIASGRGCAGYCAVEPLVDVLAPGLPRVFYHRLTVSTARKLVASLADGIRCCGLSSGRWGAS